MGNSTKLTTKYNSITIMLINYEVNVKEQITSAILDGHLVVISDLCEM